MTFNVSLTGEQIEFIASLTADKVLETTKYLRNNTEWREREIQELRAEIQKRDSMIVQKDLMIDEIRKNLRLARAEVRKLKGE